MLLISFWSTSTGTVNGKADESPFDSVVFDNFETVAPLVAGHC